MKRRRRSLAAGLFVALVGFGGPTKASSDSFGNKIKPPPRPNLSNQGPHEHSEGSKPLTRSSADGSGNILPPPPPRQQLDGIPPPRIPPPPQRASQSIQPLNMQDQRRMPPPAPPGSDESNVKANTVGNTSERPTKDETESIEEVNQPQELDSNEKPMGIELHQQKVPPPPPRRPVESNVRDNGRSSITGMTKETSTKDEPISIEEMRQLQRMEVNVNPAGIELQQRKVPPPPPRRPDESKAENNDKANTVDNVSVRATKDEAKSRENKAHQPQNFNSNLEPGSIESHQHRLPPPPPRRPGEFNRGTVIGRSERPATEDDVEKIESKAKPKEIELEQQRVPPPPPRSIEPSRVTHEDSSNTSERPAIEESGSIERVRQPYKVESNAKPEAVEDIVLFPVSKPAEEEKKQDGKKEEPEVSHMVSNVSEEIAQEPESKEDINREMTDPQEDATSSIESNTSEPRVATSHGNEESQTKDGVHVDVQKPSPLTASGLNFNTGTAFIHRQDSAQKAAPPLERAELRPPLQQGAFTMPLTHQNPMQPNRFQQQNQQGYYRQAPNPQHQSSRQAPPANVRRPPPRMSTAASSTPSFFKNILGSVEKGLDELSNMEDKIAKRAQDLVSKTASSSRVSNVVNFATRRVKSRPSRPAHSSSGRSTRPQPKTSPSADKSPFTHMGKKYENINGGTESSSPQPAVTQKLIRANGGASAPGGQTPNQPIPVKPIPAEGPARPAQPEQRQQPPQQQQQQQQQPPQQQRQPGQQQLYSQPPNQRTGPGSTPGGQLPYGASPYKQATVAQKKPDPHSRESRIPWETATKAGTPRPNQARMTVPKTFEEDNVSWKEKLMGALPRLPRLPNPAKLFRFRSNKSYQYASMDAWNDDDDDSRRGFFGLFKKESSSKLLTSHSTTTHLRPSTANSEATKTPIDNLMARSEGAETTSLLAESDESKCRSLGRYHAAFDLYQVMFLILGVQQLSGLESLNIPTSLLDLVSRTIPMVVEIIRASMATWAPFWFAYALLTNITKNIVLESKIEALAAEVGTSVEEESVYGQLYLRLIASTPMDTRLLSRLSEAAQSEVKWMIAKARLSSFTTFVACLLFFMTASVLRPAMMVVGKTVLNLVTLQDLRSWPIEWKSLWNHFTAILMTSFQKLQELFANVLVKALDKPLHAAFHASIFGALFLATVIPKIESKRTVPAIDDEEEELEIANEGLDQLSRLGASSATRLTMLSENGSVENVLERWQALNVPSADLQPGVRLSQVLRQMSYVVLAALTSFAPLLIPFLFEQASSSPGLHTGLQWDSMLDVSVIMMSVFLLIWNTLKQSTVLQASLPYVKSFLSDLSKTMEEIATSNKQQADLKLSASISASAGLAVKDLWAAHTKKRAWAVRGANLECRNGEVLAVLGDDSSGKSRLLTTIAESLITPPKRSRTSNKVRGLVAIGGLDSSKWDKPSLKRRLGILLSDVCTLGDTASIFSGWTLEEILEPVDGVQPYPRTLTSSEKSAILLGLKITGLYDTLIRRLPSKMNTVITGNEEDLGKPSVDPSTTVLSPAEWSKLLLAKVIAQTISDNDNVMASTDKIENSLMGSVLILDDVAVLLSEVEEAKVIRELRKTGSATVISSNKWATGRFADRIAVVKDGSIVEVGSHNELIARGPQRSLYAAKWHAMTMG